MVKSMNFKEERIGKITAIEQILKKISAGQRRSPKRDHGGDGV